MSTAAIKGPPVTGYSLAFASPLGAFFVLFFLAPLLLLIVISFYATPDLTSFGLDQYAKIAGGFVTAVPGAASIDTNTPSNSRGW